MGSNRLSYAVHLASVRLDENELGHSPNIIPSTGSGKLLQRAVGSGQFCLAARVLPLRHPAVLAAPQPIARRRLRAAGAPLRVTRAARGDQWGGRASESDERHLWKAERAGCPNGSEDERGLERSERATRWAARSGDAT